MRCRIFLQEMSKQLLQPQFQRRSTVARLSSAIKKSIASVVPNNEDTGETAGTARATVSSKNVATQTAVDGNTQSDNNPTEADYDPTMPDYDPLGFPADD
ncbi:hypothetical protein RvY_12222 [Ramazzottius varieornatus]|uniref:Uncharacterized protein n=1 Tax=Ramazzottius varieornatus TaxID=947166 RepID=A0A1D1VMZ7_RAMVA|nr:hypothetical protein RvY_12222 [Ramazzottius varieornatus]